MGDVEDWPLLVIKFPKQEKCRLDPAPMSAENKRGDEGEDVHMTLLGTSHML